MTAGPLPRGVFVSVRIDLPGTEVARWRAETLLRQARPEGDDDRPVESSLFGDELSFAAASLDEALEVAARYGVALPVSAVESWHTEDVDGSAWTTVRTRGVLGRRATVDGLLAHLVRAARSGDQYAEVHETPAPHRTEDRLLVTIRGYLPSWDAYADLAEPLTCLLAAAASHGGGGTAFMLGDLSVDVCHLVRAVPGAVVAHSYDKQDPSDEEFAEWGLDEATATGILAGLTAWRARAAGSGGAGER
ncbi:hypothetical protein ACWF95_07480 [Streptomyces vinaceus]